MRSHSVLSSLFVVGAAFAPAPIRLGSLASKRFILMPTSRSLPVMAPEGPKQLTIRDPRHETSAGEIPYFTAKPDDTIAWESKGLCIEASGIQNGNVVHLSQCTGDPAQKWDWSPWGLVQLKGTNQCLDILVDKKGGFNGASVVLRECENTASKSWEFEAPEKQPAEISEPQQADMLFNLAMVYWNGLSIAFLVSIFDKLWNMRAGSRSQPLASGGHVAAVMAVQSHPINSQDLLPIRATPPHMTAGETNPSAVEPVVWRLIASTVTACTSMVFTGHYAIAWAIAGWDFCSNSLTKFIGKRLRNRFDWTRDKGPDSGKYSWANALAWRAFVAFNLFFASIILTGGNAGIASKIVGADTLLKTVFCFLHKRMWAKISRVKLLSSDSSSAQKLGPVNTIFGVLNIPNSLSLARIVTLPVFVSAYYLSLGIRGLVPSATIIPTLLFAVSAFTDFLDGYLARNLTNQQTKLGSWLDPVSDKIVVCCSLLLITEKFSLPIVTIPSMIICCRELGVGGLRELFAIAPAVESEMGGEPRPASSKQLAVASLGKWKTTFQLLSLIMLFYAEFPEVDLATAAAKATVTEGNSRAQTRIITYLNPLHSFGLSFQSSLQRACGDWISPANYSLWYNGGVALLWMAAGLTIVSGWQYGKLVWRGRKLTGW